MGGGISLKVLEAKPDDFKAASLWAAVSAPYAELTVRWAEQKSKSRPDTSEAEKMRREESRRKIAEELGDPVENIRTYQAVSPGDNLQLVKTPIQLQHVKGDDSIPYQDSEILYDKLKVLGKEVEIYLLEEGDHNFSGSELDDAMKRAIEFFNRYL